MNAKVIEYDIRSLGHLQGRLDQWLMEAGKIRIDRITKIEHTAHNDWAMIIFYEPILDPELNRKPPRIPPSPTGIDKVEVTCGQCRKRPALSGKKICHDCREYQKGYRAKKKEEKKQSRYP